MFQESHTVIDVAQASLYSALMSTFVSIVAIKGLLIKK